MKRRNARQDAIRAIVRGEEVRTQQALASRLRDRGFVCTQATVSRDISDMGLSKQADGCYVLAEDVHMRRMVGDLVTGVARSDNLVVVHAASGTAQGVAAALDSAALPDVLGSVAGDDTILVVTANKEAAKSFEKMIGSLLSSR